MFIIVIEGSDKYIDSKDAYFTEYRYTAVWTNNRKDAKQYATKEEAEIDIEKFRLKQTLIAEL